MKIGAPPRIDVTKFTFPVKIKKQVGSQVIAAFCNNLKRANIPYGIVIENPEYAKYKNHVKNTPFGWWSIQNLQKKGFKIENPLKTSEDDIFNLYVITSTKAFKKFDNQFQNFKGIFRYGTDVLKSVLFSKKLIDMTRENPQDIHYKAATRVLYYGKINEYQNNRFQQLLKKLNVLEYTYKQPKNNSG
jgi:hypothetical protein